MPFEILPVLEIMIEFYRRPRAPARFQRYLALLTDPATGDIALPIGLYNPMARGHVLEKLEEFAALDAETIMAATAKEIAPRETVDRRFQVALSLADDIGGGWTNRYTTDYAARFQFRAMLRRGFRTPLFWASEAVTVDLIAERTREELRRTIYQCEHGEPKTLEEHVRQEAFAAGAADAAPPPGPLQDLYDARRGAADHPTIFAFLYGDAAARELGYPALCPQT
ncbi:hypothetical protein CCAX7_20130 [Capsulimonas corticalis]|uniref:Uncharacterized protein n=1 Tax=Capsulimonas corticalis TaxID=2219043 RepID=A0A402D2L7_9BACT|nr:hypothetical protein [Capsulimonas corticalis]BDI29962.1 hypothetical protein CCAX7_20130 [Capsulimonas corticalis]